MTTTTRYTAKSAVGRLVLTAALAAMPILTACGAAEKASAKGQTVEVHLSEGTIQMPASVPSGKTTFQVINDGTAAHGFEIEGPSGDKQVPTVEPGKRASLQIVLDPGTYRILSPVDAGRDDMVKALNVT